MSFIALREPVLVTGLGIRDVGARLRRLWWLVAVLVLVAAAGTYLTRSSASRPKPTYTSFHVLAQADGSTEAETVQRLRLDAAAVTRPDVVARATDTLGPDADPGVADHVIAEYDTKYVGVRITATAGKPDKAQHIADAFAAALLASLEQQEKAALDQQLADIAAEASRVQDQLTIVEAFVAATPTADLKAQRDALTAQSQTLSAKAQTLSAKGPAPVGLVSLSASRPEQVAQPPGPMATRTRVAIGAAAGLIAGLLVVTVLTVSRRRVQTRAHAERAFGVPLLAAVPREKKDRALGAADGYRILRIAIEQVPARVLGAGDAPRTATRHPVSGSLRADGVVQVVLVASAASGDGRTTVAANLAASVAELGLSVVVIDAAHQRPDLHRMLGAPRSPGLHELALAERPDGDDPVEAMQAVMHDTKVPGVALVPAGVDVKNPSGLSKRVGSVVRAARAWADVVIVDTSPLLDASDALELVTEVDAVVLVARAGRTPLGAAARAAELLGYVHAPVVGAVLLGASNQAPASAARPDRAEGDEVDPDAMPVDARFEPAGR